MVKPALSVLCFCLAGAASANPVGNHLERVAVDQKGDSVVFSLQTAQAPTFQSYSRGNPAVVIVDLVDTKASPGALSAPSFVKAARIDKIESLTGTLARLTVELESSVSYDVTATTHEVILQLSKNKAKGVRTASETPDRFLRAAPLRPRLAQADGEVVSDADEGEMGMATGDGDYLAMTYIGFRNGPNDSRVFARMNQTAVGEVVREGENLLVLEVRGARIPLRNNKNHLDTNFFESPVKMITPTEVDAATPVVRIIIEVRENVPYDLIQEDNVLTVVFQKSGG